MDKSINYTLGFLSGALVGSAIALLYAPENGRNIRDTLSYRLNNYLDDVNHLISRIAYEKGNISDAKEKSDKVVKDARKRAENLIHEADKLLHSIEETKKEPPMENHPDSKKCLFVSGKFKEKRSPYAITIPL